MTSDRPEASAEIKDLDGPEIREPLLVGLKNVDAHRHEIAMQLLAVFKVVILAEVAGCFLLLIAILTLMGFKLLEAATAIQLIKDGVVPLFAAASTLATAIFGQLLAFVLGFYFGGKIQGK
jgi:hypothetical protein